eukprot:GSMAST32.ASY1.ANO1.2034.1 assembled CDS
MWDIRCAEEITTISGFTSEVDVIAISPNGNQIASSGHGYNCKIWDVRNVHHSILCKGHSAKINSLCFSQDAEILASGSQDCTFSE